MRHSLLLILLLLLQQSLLLSSFTNKKTKAQGSNMAKVTQIRSGKTTDFKIDNM